MIPPRGEAVMTASCDCLHLSSLRQTAFTTRGYPHVTLSSSPYRLCIGRIPVLPTKRPDCHFLRPPESQPQKAYRKDSINEKDIPNVSSILVAQFVFSCCRSGQLASARGQRNDCGCGKQQF